MRLPLTLMAVATLTLTLSAQAPETQPPTEKSLLSEYRDASKSNDPAYRAAAVVAMADASRELDDAGASKAVAKTLAKALEDDALEVQAAAIGALSWGRQPDVVLAAFEDHIKSLRNEIEKRMTRPDEESVAYKKDATRQYADLCDALARHTDDRSVEILIGQLRTLTKNTKGGNNLSTLLSTPLAGALLELGSQEAVEAVVKQTGVYVNPGQQGPAKRLHQALSIFSDERGWAPPTYADGYDQVWRDWLGEHEQEFSEKLGKLKEPISEPEYDALARYKDARDAGRDGRRP